MEFQPKYIITPRYLTKPSKRRSGQLIKKVRFVVAHDTGNPGSTAANNVKYYENSRNEMSASAHIFVDDKEILECIPALTAPEEKAWHVIHNVTTDDKLYGVDANDAAIGVEYCYGGAIDADKAYWKYVWVLAKLCDKFSLKPEQDITGHFILDPVRRSDPVTGLAKSRRTFEQLLRDVQAEYQECLGNAPQPLVPVPFSGQATSSVHLNIRRGAPSTRALIHQAVPPGTLLDYVGKVENGESVNGNPVWFEDANHNFFWSGGVH